MYFNGPWDACKKIYATDGLRGIYFGQGSTLLREFHGYGCYFLAYELLVQRRMAKDHIERKVSRAVPAVAVFAHDLMLHLLEQDIPALDSLLYGALAGYGLWLGGAYPLDAIKSKIQTDGLPSQGDKRKYHGVLSCIRKTYATQGIGGFWKGFIPTIIRSPFANGATFAAFEITLRMIS
jgi:solute carrier family 25 carnitine/acylcarnitine transporter 20/29